MALPHVVAGRKGVHRFFGSFLSGADHDCCHSLIRSCLSIPSPLVSSPGLRPHGCPPCSSKTHMQVGLSLHDWDCQTGKLVTPERALSLPVSLSSPLLSVSFSVQLQYH